MKQTKNKTLLEQIKATPFYTGSISKKIIDPDIAIAWLKDEIKYVQISKTIWPDKKITSTTTLVYCLIIRSLREAYRQGRIKIVK